MKNETYCLDDVDYLNDKEYLTCRIFTSDEISELKSSFGVFKITYFVRGLSFDEYEILMKKMKVFQVCNFIEVNVANAYNKGLLAFDKQSNELVLYTTASRIRGFALYMKPYQVVDFCAANRDIMAGATCENQVGIIEVLIELSNGLIDLSGFDLNYYERYKELSDLNDPKSELPLDVTFVCNTKTLDWVRESDVSPEDLDEFKFLAYDIETSEKKGELMYATSCINCYKADRLVIDSLYGTEVTYLVGLSEGINGIDISRADTSKIEVAENLFSDVCVDLVDISNNSFDSLTTIKHSMFIACEIREINFGLNEFPELNSLERMFKGINGLEVLRCTKKLLKKLVNSGVVGKQCHKIDKNSMLIKINVGGVSKAKYKVITVKFNR